MSAIYINHLIINGFPDTNSLKLTLDCAIFTINNIEMKTRERSNSVLVSPVLTDSDIMLLKSNDKIEFTNNST